MTSPLSTNHKYTIHKVKDQWQVSCVCGWKEKAENMRDASIRGGHHLKYPNR